jgi:hypothetical protein
MRCAMQNGKGRMYDNDDQSKSSGVEHKQGKSKKVKVRTKAL